MNPPEQRTRSRCPHCATLQASAGNALQPCTHCGKPFYPTPIEDSVRETVQRTKRRRRIGVAQAAQSSARFWYVVRACGALILLAPMVYTFVLQLQAEPTTDGLSRTEGRVVIAVGGVLLALGQIYLSRARAALGDDEVGQ